MEEGGCHVCGSGESGVWVGGTGDERVSGRPRDAHACVPFLAASGTPRPCRLDGYTHTHRLRVPVLVRCKRKALERGRYMHKSLLVNSRRSAHQAGKVEHMSRALALAALTHLIIMPSEHPFMLECRDRHTTSHEDAMPHHRVQFQHSAGWHTSVAARAQRLAAASAALQHAADHRQAACCGRGQRQSTC